MKDKKYLILMYIIALSVSALFIIINPHTYGPWGFDGYDILGWNLAEGNGYSFDNQAPFDNTAFRLPAYPILLSLFYRIFGRAYMPVFIFHIFLNACICIFIYFLIKDFFNRKVSLFISFLVALIGFSNIYVGTLSPDMTTTFFVIFSVLILYIGYKSNKIFLFFIHGIVLSLVVLMRPSMAFLPLAYFFVFVLMFRKIKKGIVYLVLTVIGMSLLITPWVVRNYMLSKNFVPFGTQGGSQLFYGAMESGSYFQCRTYNPFHHYENLSTYRSLSQDYLTFSIYIKAGSIKKLDSIRLYFASEKEDRFYEKAFEYIGKNMFECKIPRKQNGEIIRYYIEIINDDSSGLVMPTGAPGVNYLFYSQKSSSDDFDEKDNDSNIVDVFDFAEIVQLLSEEKYATAEILMQYDYNNDGDVNKDDLLIMVNLLHNGFLTFELDKIGDIKLVGTNLNYQVIFSDDSRMILPRYLMGSKLFVKADLGIAFEILNNKYYIDRSLLLDKKLHAVSDFNDAVKIEVDSRGVIGEVNRQSLHKKLAIFYIKGHPADYFLAVMKRMLRMWITLGSSDRTISHPAPYNISYLFTIAKYFSMGILALSICGMFILRRRLKDLIFILVPVVYFPLTHSFFMINARHTISANPFILVFTGASLYYFGNKIINFLRSEKK